MGRILISSFIRVIDKRLVNFINSRLPNCSPKMFLVPGTGTGTVYRPFARCLCIVRRAYAMIFNLFLLFNVIRRSY